MKKVSILLVFIAAFLILCLPLYSMAFDVVRSEILAVEYGSDTSSTWHSSSFVVSGKQLIIKPGATLASVTAVRIYFYFHIPLDQPITQFSCDLSYSGGMPYSARTYSSGYFWLASNDQSLVYKGQKNASMVTSQNGSVQNFRISWSGYQEDANVYCVTIYFDNGVLGPTSPLILTVNEMYLNSVDVSELQYLTYQQDFEGSIEELNAAESTWWQKVITPGLDDVIWPDHVDENLSDYKSVIRSITIDNFFIPGIIVMVFTVAFYSYVLYGRKG